MNITYKRNLDMNTNEIKRHDGEEELLSVVKFDDEHMSWEEVDEEYVANIHAAIALQKDLVKVFTENEKTINEDKELFSIASGILKTIGDVVKEYKDTREVYFGDIGNEIDKEKDEDVVKYLGVQQSFVETSEKFANVTLIAVTDVMTRLNKINNLGMEKQIEELNVLKDTNDGSK
jgi:hypothetical protein